MLAEELRKKRFAVMESPHRYRSRKYSYHAGNFPDPVPGTDVELQRFGKRQDFRRAPGEPDNEAFEEEFAPSQMADAQMTNVFIPELIANLDKLIILKFTDRYIDHYVINVRYIEHFV